ncbi:MAG: TonB-dependent receptor [Candidatus Eremiobacteraeota bacterium]|nr:TonB-dependent receptor [Candidatus Eremiobacteraeota bacterium]
MFVFDALRVIAAAVTIASPSPTPSAPPEITHVVTSDRADETLRSTTRTTYVVTAADIARRGYRTVGDALAEVPGVEINRYGGIGSNVSYGIRGSSSAQVLVLIDGLPAPGEFANSVQFGTISTSGVRRVEVVEGGGSTLYGTGAIGGIINIITDAQNVAPTASALYGTFGDSQLRAQGKGFSFERIVAGNDYRVNSNYEETTARLGFDRKLGDVGVAFRGTLESDNVGAPGPYASESTTSREGDTNNIGSLTFSLKGPQSTPTLQLGGSRQSIAFGCDAATDPNCFFAAQAVSIETRSDLAFRNSVSAASSRTIYGIDLSRGIVRSDDGNGTATGVSYNAMAQSAVYAQENWALRSGDLYAGIRGERDGSLGGAISPSLGLRTELGNGVSFRLNAADAFRAPNASELYFPGYGNPNLAPERAEVGDASLRFDDILGGTTLTWFTNYTHDLIIANPNDNFAPENVAQARMQGFTLETHTLPMHGITVRVNATDLYRAEDVYLGTRLPNDPVFTVNTLLAFQGSARGFLADGGISIRTAGQRQPFDPTLPLFAQSNAYTTSDAFVRLRVMPRTLLALHAYNFGNEQYAEVSGYPMPGRTFTVELTTH